MTSINSLSMFISQKKLTKTSEISDLSQAVDNVAPKLDPVLLGASGLVAQPRLKTERKENDAKAQTDDTKERFAQFYEQRLPKSKWSRAPVLLLVFHHILVSAFEPLCKTCIYIYIHTHTYI